MQKTIWSYSPCVFLVILLLFSFPFTLFSHSGHSHGGGRRVISSGGRGLIKSEVTESDTSKLILDAYCNIGLFMAPDFGESGILGGDPLGTGGRQPWFYNALLFPDNSDFTLPITSESRISDVDTATESAVLTRNQVLVQAGIAMLGQANTMPQMALRLLS